jgi:hypothetical protein
MTEATEAGKTIARMKRKEDCLSAVFILHYLCSKDYGRGQKEVIS